MDFHTYAEARCFLQLRRLQEAHDCWWVSQYSLRPTKDWAAEFHRREAELDALIAQLQAEERQLLAPR